MIKQLRLIDLVWVQIIFVSAVTLATVIQLLQQKQHNQQQPRFSINDNPTSLLQSRYFSI